MKPENEPRVSIPEGSLLPAELRGVWTDMVAAGALGTALGEPVGSIVAAAGAPLAVGMARLIEAEWRAKQERVVAAWSLAGGESPEGVAALLAAASASPASLQFSADVSEASERSLYPERLRALAGCLSAGLLGDDDAKLDVEQQVVDALAKIDRPHLAVLGFLALPRGDETIALVGATVDRPELFLRFSEYGASLTRLVGVLVTEGLAERVTESSRGPQTYADLLEPRPLVTGWRITDFGREVLRRLEAFPATGSE